MKTIKKQITAKSKTLTATWTVDMAQDLKSLHGIDIEDEIGRTLQEEIDWSITCDMMKELGWTKVNLEWPRMTAETAHDIKEWCKSTLNGHYKARGRTWIFENEKDASMFILKWS